MADHKLPLTVLMPLSFKQLANPRYDLVPFNKHSSMGSLTDAAKLFALLAVDKPPFS